jgi:glycerol-1-phosphate dehydrogenase [NAD(P)+]
MENNERITSALKEASDTRAVAIGRGALAEVGRAFKESFGEQAAFVVADDNTWAAAGQAVAERLAAAGIPDGGRFVFPGRPALHADYEHVLEVQAALSAAPSIPIPVAVGSGTLNDIAKLAAHMVGRPYMAVATAASMDGYASFGAAITRDAFKQVFGCPAPRAVVADLDVLAAAPPHMAGWGYGDLLGKISAGADWLIADALEVEPVLPGVWSMVQGPLPDWLGQPERLRAGDRAAFEGLIQGLVMSGLAMQAMKSSRPASGSEHQFSHLWEMQGLAYQGEPVSHGAKVGLGSIAVAALYEALLERDFSGLDIPARCAAWPTPQALEQMVRRSHADPHIAASALAESLAKHPTPERLAHRLGLLRERWPALRERLKAQLVVAGEVRRMLRAAGCPGDPADVGLTRGQVKATYPVARQIRRRYTVLDLAAETGCLAGCVEQVFAPGGFWPLEA